MNLPVTVAPGKRVLIAARAVESAIEASFQALQRLGRPPGSDNTVLFWVEQLAPNRIGLTFGSESADRWYVRRRELIEQMARAHAEKLPLLEAKVLCVVCPPPQVGAAIGALHVDLLVLTRPRDGPVETGEDWWQLYVALSDAPIPVLIL